MKSNIDAYLAPGTTRPNRPPFVRTPTEQAADDARYTYDPVRGWSSKATSVIGQQMREECAKERLALARRLLFAIAGRV
jgi:hypothetical protein